MNRSDLYYKPVSKSEEDLTIKLHIDKIYTTHPEYGYRRICWYLNEKAHIPVNRKAVLRHMREMGIQAVYPRQNTSKAALGSPIYPYLLKNLQIIRPDQVWSIDITYIPIKTDWLYLVAIKEYIRGNIAFTKDYLAQYLPQISFKEPQGTYLLWLDCRALGMSAAEREQWLWHKARLSLDSGVIFGAEGEAFERLNIACPRAVLREALERLRSAAGEL